MRGAVELACEYAAERAPVRRGHRLVPGGAAPAGRRLRGHGGIAQRRAPRRLGRRRPAARRRAGRRPRWPRPTAPGRPARCARPPSRCTAASATPGSAWPTSTCAGRCCRATCSAARAPASQRVLAHHGIGGRRWTSVTRPPRPSSGSGCGTGCEANNPGLPASSTDDDYWAGQAAWHQSLYDAGFFGMSWPQDDRRPGAAERLRRDRRRGAGRRRRAAATRASATWSRASSSTATTTSSSGSCPASSTGATGGARASASPTPAPTSPSLRTRADRDGDEYVITGHKVWTSYSDDADWCLVLARTDHDVPKHKGISAFAVPMHQPGIEQRPLRMINGITKEFGEVHLRRGPRAGRQHDRRAGRGLAAGHDRRQPRARAGRARLRRPLHASSSRSSPTRAQPSPSRLRRRAGPRPRLGHRRGRDAAAARVPAAVRSTRRHLPRPGGLGRQAADDRRPSRRSATPRVAIGGAGHGDGDDTWLKVYLYSRAQSVMGGTSQIQRNLVARRILGLPVMSSYDLPPELEVEIDGPIRIVRLNRPDAAERHEPRAPPGPGRAVPADRRRPRGPGRRAHRQRAGLLGRRRLRLPRRAHARTRRCAARRSPTAARS